jgi:hypothetical protein
VKRFVALDGHGCVVSWMCLPDGAPDPEGTMPVDLDHADLRDRQWTGVAWVSRPALPEPVVVGPHLVWAGLPEGTNLRIEDDEIADMLVETAEFDILFGEPGRYRVIALPPAPWLGREVVVEVA